MGAVYEVVHRETLRRRALKVLLPSLVSDTEARARFAQEASITAEIESEHLVDTFDAGVDRDSGCPFIVMELLRGETLGERLAHKQRHEPSDVLEILRQISLVLEQTHRRGIIHRDLKPDNLFLARREDGTCRLKVLDFGIAKVLERASMSRNTVNIGTPLYMAPEQLDGSDLGPATDLFALTHIAFELLTGESYWEHELRTAPSTMVLLKWMDRGMPEPASARANRLGLQVGGDFDEWFVTGTSRSPASRHPSAWMLVEALARAMRVPFSSRGTGRLSLTGLLPIPTAPTSAGEAAQTAASRTHTDDGTTMPRSSPAIRRSQGAFVTPVDHERTRRRSTILVAIGAGVTIASVAAAATFFFDSKTTGAGDASRTAIASEAVADATRVEDPPTSSSVKSVASASSAVSSPSSSVSTKVASTTTATPRALPRVTARPTAGKRSGVNCRKEPARCRD